MEAAKEHFGIPLILTPENLASPDLDELSGMTYLSYFMKVDSPGYWATMGYTRKMLPHRSINNFQVLFFNGYFGSDGLRPWFPCLPSSNKLSSARSVFPIRRTISSKMKLPVLGRPGRGLVLHGMET